MPKPYKGHVYGITAINKNGNEAYWIKDDISEDLYRLFDSEESAANSVIYSAKQVILQEIKQKHEGDLFDNPVKFKIENLGIQTINID